MGSMATKSFLKEVTLKSRKQKQNYAYALDKAISKQKKEIEINRTVQEVRKEDIKRIFE